jgi:hypothetical protein
MKPTIRCALLASVLLAGGTAMADGQLGRKIDEVKFDFDSARVNHDLSSVASALNKDRSLTIVLDGYADPVGTEVYNVKLSLRRAEAVRDRLVRLGINGERIVIGVFGEDAARQPTHAADRRVAIRTTTETPRQIIDNRLNPATAVVFGESLDATAFYGGPEPIAVSDERGPIIDLGEG